LSIYFFAEMEKGFFLLRLLRKRESELAAKISRRFLSFSLATIVMSS